MANSNQSITYQLSDGLIEMKGETITIHDKAKKDRLLLFLTSVTSIVLSLSLIFKWAKNDDRFYLIIGLILLVPNLGLLWKWFREFTFIEDNISFSDISHFKIVDIKFSDTKVGLIILKNKTIRRVKMNTKDLQLLREYLTTKNISTST
jgi:hypothetical protein